MSSNAHRPTRRRLLRGIGAAGVASLAGCSGSGDGLPARFRNGGALDALPYDRTYPDDEGITMYRRGLRRLGYYPDEVVPGSVAVHWQRPVNYVGHTAAKSTPLPTPDGETILIPADTGQVHAVDPDGRHRWTAGTGATSLGIHGTPAVVDGIAYVGGYDGTLYAFDVESGRDVWRTPGHVLDDSIAIGASPAYWNGVLFVVTEHSDPPAGTMWAIDADTGRPLWSDDRPWGMPHPSPTIDPEHGRLLTASNDGVVYCWAFPSLEFRWSFQTGGEDGPDGESRAGGAFRLGAEIKGTVATYEGRAYVGSWDGHVYSLALEDGAEEWSFETGGRVMSDAAVHPDGIVYVGSHDRHVYALEADSGEQLWDANVGGRVIGAVAVTDETVLVGSYDSHLYALDRETGDRRWRVENRGHVTSQPVPHDGRIYYAERAAFSNYWDDDPDTTVMETPGHAYCLVGED